MTFESSIDQLADPNKKLSATQMVGLSGLDRDQLETFTEAWEEMAPERRLSLITDLAELIEDNIDLNYDAIFKLALNDEEPLVRAAAIAGLYEYEGSDLIPVLAGILLADPESEVRAEAAVALGRFAMAAEFDRLHASDVAAVKKALTESVEDEDEEDIVRAKAIEALGVLSDEGTRHLIESVYAQERLWLRIGAVDAMGRSCDEVWLPVVINEMTNRAPEMRQAAAFAAGEIASDAAVQPLTDVAVHDPDRQVQLAAIHALGEIGGSVAKVALQAVLYRGDEELQAAVEEAMAEVSFKEDPLNPLGS